MLFVKKKNYALGLDISDLYLRAAQSRPAGEHIKIQALSIVPVEKGVIQNEEIKNPDTIVKKISELLSRPKFGLFTSNEAVVKLPCSMTYIKYLELEKTPNNLADTVANEIEKHIPFSRNDIYFDYQLIKSKDNFNYVLVGAAPKNVVDQYIAILKFAKLELSALEINSVCDCRCLMPNEKKPSQKNGVFALVDIGDFSSSLTIYAENSIILSISMPISSAETTDYIAKTLELKPEQAEKAKIVCGFDKSQANGIIYDILSKMTDSLLAKIGSSFEYLSSHYPEYGQVSEILLYGNGANIKNLDILIAKRLNIPTRVSSPLLHFSEDEAKILNVLKKDKNSQDYNPLPSYTSAIGLSLRNIFLKVN